jgi:internalin A
MRFTNQIQTWLSGQAGAVRVAVDGGLGATVIACWLGVWFSTGDLVIIAGALIFGTVVGLLGIATAANLTAKVKIGFCCGLVIASVADGAFVYRHTHPPQLPNPPAARLDLSPAAPTTIALPQQGKSSSAPLGSSPPPNGRPTSTVDQQSRLQAAIAGLFQLGWTLKTGPNGMEFEINGKSLPSIETSAAYFAQIEKPFWLNLYTINNITGLHFLAHNPRLYRIDIGASDFSDFSELRGFIHLKLLSINQVPLNGTEAIDISALATLVNLETLNLNCKIANIVPIANLRKVKSLSIESSLLTDLTPLRGYTTLESLSVRGPHITDLTPILGNQNLRELTISAQQTFGLSALSILPNLKSLTVIGQGNIDVTSVGQLARLETLEIVFATNFDASPLQNLHELRSLQIQGLGISPIFPLTVIKDMDVIGTLQKLDKLTLGGITQSDIGFVRGLSSLEELNIGSMPISSIEPMRDLKSLKRVSLMRTQVSDISPLFVLPQLIKLTVIGNPVRADALDALRQRGVDIN